LTTTKVVELVGESQKSWEDAVDQALQEASQTIDNVTGVEVLNMTASVDNGKISGYKVNLHLAFPVKENR